jgi:transcription elongation GreA/GreB family factor
MIGAKHKLYQHCVNFLDERISVAREAIREAQASANDETKSSAGDKYETGRAMMQLEIEKNTVQLQEARKQREILENIAIDHVTQTIQLGSFVITESETFFLAISIGLQVIDGKRYAIISPATPIGKSLVGLKVGDKFIFAGKQLTILQIL